MSDVDTAATHTRSVLDRVWGAVGAAGAIGVLLLCVHTIVNAALRGLGGAGLTGTIEVVGFWYMPLIALFGFSVAKRAGEHIEAGIVYDRLPTVMRRDFDLVAHALLALLSIAFAWFGWQEAVHSMAIAKTAGISSVPVWPTYFLLPLGFGLLALQTVLDGVRVLRERTDS